MGYLKYVVLSDSLYMVMDSNHKNVYSVYNPNTDTEYAIYKETHPGNWVRETQYSPSKVKELWEQGNLVIDDID